MQLFRRKRSALPSTAGIVSFWEWWTAEGAWRSARAVVDGELSAIVPMLSPRIEQMHPDLSWEFGPGRRSEQLLVVTAAGDPQLRALARRWLHAAPPADPMWEYADARPPERDLGWALGVGDHEVDAAGAAVRWAADHDRACVDVVVSHRVFRHVSEEARTQLTFLLLDHALGEQAVETWIGDVTSVADLTEPPDGDLADLAQAVERFADAHAGDDGEPAWRLLEARAPSGQVLLAMAQVPLRPATMPHLDTHVRVELPYYLGNDAELPVDESLAALRAAEDGIAARLGLDGRVVAHETTGGLRTLHVYVDSATDAVERVRAGAATWPEGRPRTVVTVDPAWDAVAHLRG